MTGPVNFAADNYVAQAITEFAADIAAASPAERPAVLAESISTLAYIKASQLSDDQLEAALKHAPQVDNKAVNWQATLGLRDADHQFAATPKFPTSCECTVVENPKVFGGSLTDCRCNFEPGR